MIVRDHLRCATCGTPHTVRVGVGQEQRHSHKFVCRGCGEEIGVTLATDPPGAWIEFDENCERATAEPGAAIVNLDANFLIPADQQGVDFVMPRLQQQHQIVEAILAAGGRFPSVQETWDGEGRPPRGPNYGAEWIDLQRAWSLSKNGQAVLARAQVKKANATICAKDPIDGVSDWFWRFATSLVQPAYEPLFKDAIEAFKPLHGTPLVADFRKHYADKMRAGRASKYVKVIREYFAGYSDYAQLHFLVAAGVDIDPTLQAAGVDFLKTGMFYGNAFEALGDLIDVLAMANNMLQGRPFDTFERLSSLKAYYELDKSSRQGPFLGNPAFAGFVAEFDNQLRNASHHAGIEFDRASSTLTCRAGKGGQGAERTLTYTEYLQRCVGLFMATMSLLRLELVLTTQLRVQRIFE